jgi:hypothetical protein
LIYDTGQRRNSFTVAPHLPCQSESWSLTSKSKEQIMSSRTQIDVNAAYGNRIIQLRDGFVV